MTQLLSTFPHVAGLVCTDFLLSTALLAVGLSHLLTNHRLVFCSAASR